MKHRFQYILLFLFFFALSGCSGSDAEDSVETRPSVDMSVYTDIPVLSIETKNTAKNAMDFVTKPVSGHVSSAIASWTPGYIMPPEPYYEACSVTLTDKDGTVLLNGANAEVKVRGNWTTSYDKKPLRIKFEQSQNLLGLNDGATFKNWLLLAEYKDASMLRNKTAYAVARELFSKDGLYASDAELVEVVINGQYWGVYLLAEQQQINSDRVNITEAAEGYTGTDIGYFLEFDGYFWTEDPLQQFFVDYADNAALVPFDGNDGSGRTMKCLSDTGRGRKKDIGISIKNDIYSEEQRDFIASFVDNVYNIMYYAAYEGTAYVFNNEYTQIQIATDITPMEAVARVIDVQSLVDTYIINELLCDADVYWSSFYMSADFGSEGNKKLTFQAPWDFDSAMGNKDRCVDGTGFYAANIVPDVNGGPHNGGYETVNPWLTVLIYEDWFREAVKSTWTAAYDNGIFSRALTMIAEDTDRCQAAFLRNYEKWDNIVQNYAFVNELSHEAARCRTQQEAADFLARWFESRVDFLNSHWHN